MRLREEEEEEKERGIVNITPSFGRCPSFNRRFAASSSFAGAQMPHSSVIVGGITSAIVFRAGPDGDDLVSSSSSSSLLATDSQDRICVDDCLF